MFRGCRELSDYLRVRQNKSINGNTQLHLVGVVGGNRDNTVRHGV